MRLKKINIENFHCYKQEEFDFAGETTVLIGKNGSGKSSLIKAIKTALSVFFSNNTKWGYKSLAASVSDLRVANLNVREVWHDKVMSPAEYVKITTSATIDNQELPEWSFYKLSTANANVQTSYYKDAFVAFMESYAKSGKLPIITYYSDRFPHIDTKLGESIKSMIENDELLDRSWGYYHWDYDTSCATIWQKRFIRIYNLWLSEIGTLSLLPNAEDEVNDVFRQRRDAYAKELGYIAKFLLRFTDNQSVLLSDKSETMKIQKLYCDGVEDKYIGVIFSDGRQCRWDELPAGYERLLNIVFDMAYRSLILNGADEEPSGIAIIDELDLHLHPSLEQDVLTRLRHAFPKMQFIVSTHSPLVVSSFKQDENNTIVQLLNEDGEYTHYKVNQPYGQEVDKVMLGAFNLPSLRTAEVQMHHDALWECLNNNDIASDKYAAELEWLKSNVNKSDIMFAEINLQTAIIKKKLSR